MKAGLAFLSLAYILKKLILTLPILLTYDTFVALKSIFTGSLFLSKSSEIICPEKPIPSLQKPLAAGALYTATGGFGLWVAMSSTAVAIKISLVIAASALAVIWPVALGLGGFLLLAGISAYICRKYNFFGRSGDAHDGADNSKQSFFSHA